MNSAPKSLISAFIVAVMGTVFCGGEPPPAPAPAITNPASSSGPRIQFATPVYDFQRAAPGESLKYSFIFTNAGNQPLEISAVRPGCGCTTAGEWTRRVKAGRTGLVPIQLKVEDAWPSGPITKTVTVDCNDPIQPWVVLQIQGTVWKPIDVAPMLASFNLATDSSAASTSVRIFNNTGEPIVLSAPRINHPAFSVVLRTNQPDKEFELIVAFRPPFTPGTIQGQIKLKTSSSALREIAVPVYANVQPVIVVMPPQIILRALQPGASSTPTVTIRNNGTNSLTLSNPLVSAKNVSVQIKELDPGRTFAATLNFPLDFEILDGQSVMFSVKSSHPQFPEIKVPIIQMARPASAARKR